MGVTREKAHFSKPLEHMKVGFMGVAQAHETVSPGPLMAHYWMPQSKRHSRISGENLRRGDKGTLYFSPPGNLCPSALHWDSTCIWVLRLERGNRVEGSGTHTPSVCTSAQLIHKKEEREGSIFDSSFPHISYPIYQ